MKKSWDLALLLAMLPFVGLAGCGGREETSLPAEMDVLLITVDTLRFDSLGFMGGSTDVTPTLDRLAAGCVLRFPLKACC